MRDHTLEALWRTTPPPEGHFDPACLGGLPEPAARYLRAALAPGTPLYTAVRLHMKGELRLDGAWHPFTATQVSRWDRGFVWRARAWMKGLPVSGFDRLVDGAGQMRWRLFGLVPVVTADGPEVSRSAAGRCNAEVIWLPTALLSDEVRWTESEPGHAGAAVSAHGEDSRLDLDLDEAGGLRAVTLRRWGDLGTGDFRYEPFGARVEAQGRFQGVTVPTEVRVGWFPGTERFEAEGEFFRATVEAVEFR